MDGNAVLKKSILIPASICGALILGGCTVQDVIGVDNAGSSDMSLNGKVVLGLKTALKVGIDSSALSASRINGYLANKAIKILLPEEAAQALQAAQQVGAYIKPFASQLQAIQAVADYTPGIDQSPLTQNLDNSGTVLSDIAGLGTLSDSLIFYMNRAAEYAAPRSVPIFKDAITGMSITDGLTILNSSDSTAATAFLNGKTFDPLVSAYSPIVDSTLALVPLTKYWDAFRTTYNFVLADYNGMLAFQQSWNGNAVVASLPALQINGLQPVTYKPIETKSLGAWTTGKALTGLFFLVGEQEKDIRRDPLGYARNLAADISEILEEVFGQIMRMQS